ncbi:glycosylphosphatidylinositol anchor biosynthesis [Blastocladiella emersonii ATCC 22665]|nr:glycosylphosphatidylinositol anchor biosynthesis [Blastocladiella emersonii ATCC 22665]
MKTNESRPPHSVHEPLVSSPRSVRVLALLVVFRVWNALSIATFFSPDEYWQSLEIAYLAVFGHGAATWEWMPGIQLRGFAHPAIYAAGYKALAWLGIAQSDLLIALPRVQQGILAALADYMTFRLARSEHGPRTARWALIASCASWFNWFSLPPWNFVRFNIGHDIASFYGTHPWHWYLSSGWPTLLGPYLLLLPWFAADWARHWTGRLTRGVMDASWHLRRVAAKDATASVYWMAPCHSAPLYSYIGRPIRTGWLTCEPPVHHSAQNADEYQDESDVFYANVTAALEQWRWSERWRTASVYLPRNVTNSLVPDAPASHLVVFDALWQSHQSVGVLTQYKECGRYFNSHWHDDARRHDSDHP